MSDRSPWPIFARVILGLLCAGVAFALGVWAVAAYWVRQQ